MKHFLLAISILTLSSSESAAQWSNAYFPNPEAFGVLDTNLFASQSGSSGMTYRYTTPGNWIESDSGLVGTSVLSFGSIGSIFFAGTADRGIMRSTDHGTGWIVCRASVGNTCFATIGNIIIGAGSGAFRSTDSGKDWTNNSTGLPNNNVSSLATLGKNVFVGTASGIGVSTDSGNSWQPTGFNSGINALVVLDTILFAATNGGVYQSKDSGSHWVCDTVGLFNPLVISLVTDGKNLFAGTGGINPNGISSFGSGVFLSTDSGATWDTVNNGLPQHTPTGSDDYLSVNALGLFDTLLFVGVWDGAGVNNRTYVRSIKEILKKDTTEGVVQTVHSADSIEIYPNPASGIVTIISGGISIYGVNVLNVLGEDVLDMPNSRESEVSLDLSKLPAGTYFFKIQTSSGTQLRKITIER
jgi:Secretion system C-terminal sorting domain